MANPHLASYLNDHLANASAAIDLLDHLERRHGSSPIGTLAAALREDEAADREALEALMNRLGIAREALDRPAGRLAGLLADAGPDELPPTPARLLSIVEALSLGIEGKRLLWRSLKTAAVYNPELQGTDYAGLERRADEQRIGIEPFRMGAAKGSFAPA